ncbi:uncharacterized protein LOC127279881 [Leptopilina boulardi]|uniref:uncharacterized protein LOC127279881 n=1 Tax=Leptopilina boulardi TaxID=63433 RepID=UPI0021F5259F|nr:uncharacterized protein LOC127279881 [Leptopilina boulardi]
MFKKLFEHRIRKDANGYYCYLCKIPIKNEDVLNHCDSKNVSHNKFRQLIVNEFEKELQNLSDEKFEELIKNEIVQVNHGVYYCNVCDCIMPRLCHVIEHISGQRHVNKVFNKHDTSRNNSYFCSLCKIHLYCETNFKEHIFGRKHREKEELRLSKIDFYKPLPSLKESVSSSNNFLSQSSTISLPVQFTCFVCDSNFWYKEAMAEHIFKSKRDCKISSLLYLKELNDGNLIYHCTLCKVDLSYCSLDLIKHSQGKKHKLSVKDFKEKVRLNNMHVLPKNESVDQVQKGLDNLNLVSHSMDEKSKCSYRCYVCNVTVCGDVELLQHLHDLKHKHILSTYI